MNTQKARTIKASRQGLFPQLEEMGFFIMFAEPTPEDVASYEETKRMLGREDLPFTPLREYVCERPLSSVTYLYIEAYYSRTWLGKRSNFVFDFYKARYVKGSEPRSIRVYGQELSHVELLKCLKKFSFLRKEGA